MRLIDADRLEEEINSLRCTLTGLRAGKGVLARAADEHRKTILQIIDDQPTAFDKEKVIEELRSEIHLTVYDPMLAGRYIKKERAIDIVKKGGIE